MLLPNPDSQPATSLPLRDFLVLRGNDLRQAMNKTKIDVVRLEGAIAENEFLLSRFVEEPKSEAITDAPEVPE